MREVLEPLALIPGVCLTAMISPDGVPIASLAGQSDRGAGGSTIAAIDNDGELGNMAAQVAGWVADVDRAVGQLAWEGAERLVLRGSQASIIVQRGPNAFLLVWLESNMGTDELRVPMDGAIARMQRLLRSVGTTNTPIGATPSPPGPLPKTNPSESSSNSPASGPATDKTVGHQQ
ncbi:MAG: putative regulator of Ras-like GTPase activity (Roadblock/LC7/MglB family) [Planctomycetota bacterium]|jgi:predicted regulator of Ras-like GTPase activity (Roadblock/LC7/MglB family)